MDKEQLKQKVCAAIDARGREIIEFGDDILQHPELGYKEERTAEKTEQKFREMGLRYQKGIALTGLKARLTGKTSDISVCIMGEMDSVLCPGHPFADPKTGAAHSCGHNGQLAATIGAGMGLLDAGAMQYLGGDVALVAMPAEEAVELEFRNRLREQGKIEFLGGKQQFVVEGAFDDIDLVLAVHAQTDPGFKMGVGGTNNGFIAKYIRYKGKEAHSGAAPHAGVNALNAALIGLLSIHAQRETFKDSDNVRIHPIMTKGGDLVNVVPADVRIEMFVRAKTTEAVLDANKKVDRALQAGALAIGADLNITNLPGYLPRVPSPELNEVCRQAAAWLVGDDVVRVGGHVTASSDVGDLSHLMPVASFSIGGVQGVGHSENYAIVDPDLFYLGAAKQFAVATIDLLWDDAATARQVKASYKPPYTKETWYKLWQTLCEAK